MTKSQKKVCRSPNATQSRERFPPDRAFVVQLSAAEQAGRPQSGRVEHVVSGRSARFDSLERLSEFFGEVLAVERCGLDADEED
jgi:hypothetical protein